MEESWSPAGGEVLSKGNGRDDDNLSPVLGIARIPSWRLTTTTFMKSLGALLERHGVVEEDTWTEETLHAGQNVMDVFIRLRSELAAEAVKYNIDGAMLEGRKLQVKYAR